MEVEPYYEQLLQRAGSEKALKDAFVRAGMPTSTFYRCRKGNSMTFMTAARVIEAIEDNQ